MTEIWDKLRLRGLLTQERLIELLEYEEDEGVFRWRKFRAGRTSPGSVAGTLCSQGYRRISIDGLRYAAHRLAWLYVYGKWPKGEIDHIDHARCNNAIKNLRDVPVGGNQKNKRIRKDNSSGVSGVYLNKKYQTWSSQIRVNKKNISLYSGKDFFEAVCARKVAENDYGFHPNHGSK